MAARRACSKGLGPFSEGLRMPDPHAPWPGLVLYAAAHAKLPQNRTAMTVLRPRHTATRQVQKIRAGQRTLRVCRCAAERRRHELRRRVVVFKLIDLGHTAQQDIAIKSCLQKRKLLKPTVHSFSLTVSEIPTKPHLQPSANKTINM